MKKILVVDDSKIIRGKFVEYLKSSGYKTVTASNGKESVEIVQKEPFDLILMDLIMPVMDGFEAIRRIREIKSLPFIPIIVISSLETPDDLKKAMKLGANEYIFKPIDEEAFSARVQAMLHLKDFYEKIKTSERKYETLLQSLPDVVYKLDLKGNFVFISDSVKRLGFDPQKIIGKHFSEIIHPDDVPSVSRSVILSKLAGKTVGENDSPKLFDERRSMNRATKNLEIRLTPPGTKGDNSQGLDVMLTIAFGEVVSAGHFDSQKKETLGTVGIIRDITERKQAEDVRQNLEARVRQMQKLESLGVLAGGIAHDFNNILTGIVGFAEFTRDNVSEDSEVYSNMEQILKASLRARDLVKQILAFSRINKSQEFRPAQLHPVIKEALKLIRAAMPATIEIHQNIDENVGTVNADLTQMHQVVMNLFTNAEQAMRDKGGVLGILLESAKVDSKLAALYENLNEGDYLKITISDTGHGMNQETLEKIFDPFFTTREVAEGSGLGLSIVHGIVMTHGGEIIVNSEPGKSTTVQVYLPITQKTKQDIIVEVGSAPRGSERILLVDDEKTIVTMGNHLLKRLGYEVVAKTDSVEALEVFKADPQGFDLIITDQTMPRMTGEELAKELMNVRPDIPIIICTGYSHIMTPKKAKAIGIKAFIMKPFNTRNIANTIRKVLDQSAENKQI